MSLKRLDELQLANLCIMQHDGVDVLERLLPPALLDGSRTVFPDPAAARGAGGIAIVRPLDCR